jgi:hypothetical protein
VNTFKKYLIPLTLFILTTLVAGWFSGVGVEPHHDGIMFKPALDVSRGAVLFRDTFTQYGALTTFLQAWAILLFGPYLLTIRLFTAVCYGAVSVLLYLIGKKLMPIPLAVLTVLLWLLTATYLYWGFLPWASVYALVFQLAGTYALMVYMEKGNTSLLFWAGTATAATFFTRQPGGVFMAVAVYAYIFILAAVRRLSLRSLLSMVYLYTGGIILVSSVFIIWLASVRALNDFRLQSIQFAYNFGTKRTNTIFTALFPSYWNYLWSILPIASVLSGITYLFRVIKTNNRRAKMILIAAAIGLSGWLQYYPVPDDRHFYWGAAGMYPLLSLTVYELVQSVLFFIPRNRTAIALAASAAVLLVLYFPYVSFQIARGIDKVKAPYVIARKPEILRGIRLTATDAQFYASVSGVIDAYFRDNPGGSVINLSRDALYMAFNPHIRNIHPAYVNWYELYVIYPEFPAQMNAYIDTYKPLVIGTKTVIPSGYCPIAISPAINDIVLSLPCP